MKYCSFDDSIVWVFFDRVNHELKILRRDLTRLFSRPSFCKMSRRIYVTEFFWRTNKWRRLWSWVNSSSVSTFLVSGVIAAFYRCIQHFFLLLKLCVYVYFHDSVVPSVSFRPVYTGLDTVGLLLTKTTNHIQGISLWSKTLFQALCLAGAPLHFFLQADYSNNPFYYFLFPFFLSCGERSHCHIINWNSVPVLLCPSLTWKRWQKPPKQKNCQECIPCIKSWSNRTQFGMLFC